VVIDSLLTPPPPQESPFLQLKEHLANVTGAKSSVSIEKGMRLLCGNPEPKLPEEMLPLPPLEISGYQRFNLMGYLNAWQQHHPERTEHVHRIQANEQSLWSKKPVWCRITPKERKLVVLLRRVSAPTSSMLLLPHAHPLSTIVGFMCDPCH
jgi:hypothetical protein